MTTCSVKGCDQQHTPTSDLCRLHYVRAKARESYQRRRNELLPQQRAYARTYYAEHRDAVLARRREQQQRRREQQQ